jgi:aminoglycoside phosphotransferase (APT) family kinase protein
VSDEASADVSIDAAALRQYLESTLGEDRPVELSSVPEGRSNETVVVTWGDRGLILRKPPAGESSEAAHDVLREYRIMDALQGTAVPTPETILSCDDHESFDAEFYLMERLEGHVVRGEEPAAFAAPDARERFGAELIDTLAAIHTVDVEAVGLDDLGHPDGFTERQVDRWGKQLEWALDRTERRDELADITAVGDWLEANVPDDPPQTLVHGDYKIDNVFFGPDAPPEIVGALDWEMGTYGDPLTDLGWFLIHWHDAGDPDPILPDVTPPFLAREGYPSRRDLVERYERASGIDFEHERFYRGLAAYKEVAACEVFYARYLQGTENPFFEDLDEAVPRVAARAKRIVDGDEPL